MLSGPRRLGERRLALLGPSPMAMIADNACVLALMLHSRNSAEFETKAGVARKSFVTLPSLSQAVERAYRGLHEVQDNG